MRKGLLALGTFGLLAALSGGGVVTARHLTRQEDGAPAPRPPVPGDPKTGGAYRNRYEWMHMGRGTPESVAHVDRLAKELAQRPRFTPRALSWQQIGPLDFDSLYTPYPALDWGAGRIMSIAPHPTDASTLFIGTVGGLFVTRNAGAAGSWTWQRADVGLLPAEGYVAFSDTDPQTLFYGLGGEAASGLFVSRNGGSTWTATGLGPRSVRSLFVKGNLIVVGTTTGIFKSSDGGATFIHPVMPSSRYGGPEGGTVNSIVQVSPTVLLASNNDWFYTTSFAYYGELFRSTDGGNSWAAVGLPSQVAGSARGKLRLANAQVSPNTVYASTGLNGILKSTDGGASFTYLAANLAPGPSRTIGGAEMLLVDPQDATKIFLGSVDLYRSLDGGQSWAQISSWHADRLPYLHADMHSAAFTLAGTRVLLLGHDGGLSSMPSPYVAIPQASGTYPSTPRYFDSSQNRGRGDLMMYRLGSTIAPTPANARAMAVFGTQDHGTIGRSDPAALQKGYTIGTGDGFGALIHKTNGNLWLVAGYQGYMLKSTDAGKNFHQSNSGISTPNPLFYTELIQGASADTVYHVEPQQLYRTTTFGDSWSQLPLNGVAAGARIRFAGASPRNDRAVTLLLEAAPWGYTTTDLSNYRAFGAVPGMDRAPLGIAYDPTNDDVLYLGSSSWKPSANHAWKSTNGGQTWAAIDGPTSGLPQGVPVNAIRLPDSNASLVFAGTALGVYVSCNAGVTFSEAGSGFPRAEVNDLWVAPDASFVRAITYGNGAYELTLSSSGSPLVIAPPASTTVAPGSKTTLVATGGNELCYTWSLSDNRSGGSITQAGVYTAGGQGGVTDTVQVLDGSGNKATVQLTVSAGLKLSPTQATAAPKETLNFTAQADVGAVLTWTLTQNASGGTVSATGVYVAGGKGDVTDELEVADGAGNKAFATVTVTSGVSVSPSSASVVPTQPVTFTAQGGKGGYAWALVSNGSGAAIDAQGRYTAGATGGMVDIVEATDSLGNRAQAVVQVVQVPGGGTGPTEPSKGVCGCQAGGLGSLAALAVLWALRRRRR